MTYEFIFWTGAAILGAIVLGWAILSALNNSRGDGS